MKNTLTLEEELAIIKELENCRSLSAAEDRKMKLVSSTSDVQLLKKYMQGVYD